MSHLLARWLLDEVKVPPAAPVNPHTNEVEESKFENGYWLAYILYLLNQLPEFNPRSWPNNEHGDAKVHNFSRIEPVLRHLGIKFDSETARKIIHCKPGTLTHILYQLRNVTSPLPSTTGQPMDSTESISQARTGSTGSRRTFAPFKHSSAKYESATHNIFVKRLTRIIGNQNDMYLRRVLQRFEEEGGKIENELQQARNEDKAQEQARFARFRQNRRETLNQSRQKAEEEAQEAAKHWQRNAETRLAQLMYTQDIENRIKQSRTRAEEEKTSKEAENTYEGLDEFEAKLWNNNYQKTADAAVGGGENTQVAPPQSEQAEAVMHRLRRRKAVRHQENSQVARRRASYLVTARQERLQLHSSQRLQQLKQTLCKQCTREKSLVDMARSIRKYESVFRMDRMSRSELIDVARSQGQRHHTLSHSSLYDRRRQEHTQDLQQSISNVFCNQRMREQVSEEKVQDDCEAIVHDILDLAAEAALLRNTDGADIRATARSLISSSKEVECANPPVPAFDRSSSRSEQKNVKSSRQEKRKDSTNSVEMTDTNPLLSIAQKDHYALVDFKQSISFSISGKVFEIPRHTFDGSGDQFWREIESFFGAPSRPSFRLAIGLCVRCPLPSSSELGVERTPSPRNEESKQKGKPQSKSKQTKGEGQKDEEEVDTSALQREARTWFCSKIAPGTLPSGYVPVAGLGLETSDNNISEDLIVPSILHHSFKQKKPIWGSNDSLAALFEHLDSPDNLPDTEGQHPFASTLLQLSEETISRVLDSDVQSASNIFDIVLERFSRLSAPDADSSTHMEMPRLPDFSYTAAVLGPPGFGTTAYASHVAELHNLLLVSPWFLLSECIRLASGECVGRWHGHYEKLAENLGTLYMETVLFATGESTKGRGEHFDPSVNVAVVLIDLFCHFDVSITKDNVQSWSLDSTVTDSLLQDALENPAPSSVPNNYSGWILDNFPQSVSEASTLENALRASIGHNDGVASSSSNNIPLFQAATTQDDSELDRQRYSVNSDATLLKYSNMVLSSGSRLEDISGSGEQTPRPSYPWTIKHVMRLVVTPNRVVRKMCGNWCSGEQWKHIDDYPPRHEEGMIRVHLQPLDRHAHFKSIESLTDDSAAQAKESSFDSTRVIGATGYTAAPIALSTYFAREAAVDDWFNASGNGLLHRIMLWKPTFSSREGEGHEKSMSGGVYDIHGNTVGESTRWEEYHSAAEWKQERFDFLNSWEVVSVLSKIMEIGKQRTSKSQASRAQAYRQSSDARLKRIVDETNELMAKKSERSGRRIDDEECNGNQTEESQAEEGCTENDGPTCNDAPPQQRLELMIPPPLPVVEVDESHTTPNEPANFLAFSATKPVDWNTATQRSVDTSKLLKSAWDRFVDYYENKKDACLRTLQREDYSSRYRLRTVNNELRTLINTRWSGYERIMRYAQTEINSFSFEARNAEPSTDSDVVTVGFESIRQQADRSVDGSSPETVMQYLHGVVNTARMAMLSGVWAKREYVATAISSYLRDNWLAYVENSILSYGSELLEAELERLLLCRSILVAYYKLAEGGSEGIEVLNSVWKYAREDATDEQKKGGAKAKKPKPKGGAKAASGEGAESADDSDDETFSAVHELYKQIDVPVRSFCDETSTDHNDEDPKSVSGPAMQLELPKCELVFPLRPLENEGQIEMGVGEEEQKDAPAKWFEVDAEECEKDKLLEDLKQWVDSPSNPNDDAEACLRHLVRLAQHFGGRSISPAMGSAGEEMDTFLSELARSQTQLWLSTNAASANNVEASTKKEKGSKTSKKGTSSGEPNTTQGIQEKLADVWAQCESWRRQQAPADSNSAYQRFLELLKQCGGFTENIMKLSDAYKRERRKNKSRLESQMRAELNRKQQETEKPEEDTTKSPRDKGKKSNKSHRSQEESAGPPPEEDFLFLDDSLFEAITFACQEFVSSAQYITETIAGLCQQVRAYYSQTFNNALAECQLALAEELNAINSFSDYAHEAIDKKIRLPFALCFTKPYPELHLARSLYSKTSLLLNYPEFVTAYLKTHFEVDLATRVVAKPLENPPLPEIGHDSDTSRIRPSSSQVMKLAEKLRICSMINSGKGLAYTLEVESEEAPGKKKGKSGKQEKNAPKTDNLKEASSKPRFLNSEVLEAAHGLGKPWPDVGPAGPFYGRTFKEEELYNELFDLPPAVSEDDDHEAQDQSAKTGESKAKGEKGGKKQQGGESEKKTSGALANLLSAELERQSGKVIPAGYGIPKEDFIRIIRESAEDQTLPDCWKDITDEGLERLARLFRINIEHFQPVEQHVTTEPAVNFQKRVEYSQWQEDQVLRKLREAEKEEEEMEAQEAERLGIPKSEVRRRQGKANDEDSINLSDFFEQSRPFLPRNNNGWGEESLQDNRERESEDDVPMSEVEPDYYSGIFAQLCPGPLSWKLRYEDQKRMERISKNVSYHPLWHLTHRPISKTPQWLDETRVSMHSNTESFDVSGRPALNDIATLNVESTPCHSYGCRWESEIVRQVAYHSTWEELGESAANDLSEAPRNHEANGFSEETEELFRKLYPYSDVEHLVDWRKFIVFLLVVGPPPKVLRQVVNRYLPDEEGIKLRRSLKKVQATTSPFMLPLEHAYKSTSDVERLYFVPDVGKFATVVGTAWGSSRWPTLDEIRDLGGAVSLEQEQWHDEEHRDADEVLPSAFSFESSVHEQSGEDTDGPSTEHDALQHQLSVYKDASWIRTLSKCICSWQNPASCPDPGELSDTMRYVMNLCQRLRPWFAAQNVTSKTDDEIKTDKDLGMYRTPNEYRRMADLFDSCCKHLRRQGLNPEEYSAWHCLLSGHVKLGSIVYSDFSQRAHRYRMLEEEEYKQYADLADRNVYSSVSFGDAEVASTLFLYLNDINGSIQWKWIERILEEKQAISQENPSATPSVKLKEVLEEPDTKVLNDLFGWLLRLRKLGSAKAKAQKKRRLRRQEEQKTMQVEDQLSDKLRETDSDPKKKKKKGSKK